MQWVAGSGHLRIREVGDAERPHLPGVRLRPASDAIPQLVVADLEHRPDQRSDLSGRFDMGDVLESALHLGPFPAPLTIDSDQIVLE